MSEFSGKLLEAAGAASVGGATGASVGGFFGVLFSK